ncbi:hypothetical protein D3C76_1328760 [compost metagenome]
MALEGDDAIAGFHIDVQAFGLRIPQQLGFDRGRECCVFEALGDLLSLPGLIGQGFVDHQLIVDLGDAGRAQCNLFREFSVHLAFNTALECGRPVVDCDFDLERAQVSIECQRGPYRAFLTRFLHLCGQFTLSVRGGAEAQDGQRRSGEDQRLEWRHGVSPA